MKYSQASPQAVNGTWLQGHISADYDQLVKLFGEPNEGDGYKIDAEWDIQFEDGIVATIYNWKNGYNYCGQDGTALSQIHHWHVGGRDGRAVERVQKVLETAAGIAYFGS